MNYDKENGLDSFWKNKDNDNNNNLNNDFGDSFENI